jgi:transposase
VAFGPWAHPLQLLQTIPGAGEKVAQVIIAESGGDMSRFPTPENLASWAGVSAGTRGRQASATRCARRTATSG